MEESFIIKFLKGVIEITGNVARGVSAVPYKGFRYSVFTHGNNFKKQYYGFKNLEQRGFIKRTTSDHFVFTSDGKQWLAKSFNRYFPKKHHGPWDKKWRIIIFDIPQEKHIARIRFRNKLKSLGCVMLQKSVFIFPYECHEEIGDICESLEIGDYVDILIAESIGFKEAEFLKIFGLKR
ncbi:MAG: CRISPR-associated endonuclease Cas2 [bacterium]|nr:CRISPR-associated endonuclease Cas2 [bacterium]